MKRLSVMVIIILFLIGPQKVTEEHIEVQYIFVPDELFQSEKTLEPKTEGLGRCEQGMDVAFYGMEVPNGSDGSFKTYMDYRAITDESSNQWALQQDAITDEEGFRRYDEFYMVAVGTFYSSEVGERINVTLSNGNIIQCIVGDIKQDIHTDSNNQYVPMNGNIIEFIIDSKEIDSCVTYTGNVSSLEVAGSKIFEGEVVEIMKLVR